MFESQEWLHKVVQQLGFMVDTMVWKSLDNMVDLCTNHRYYLYCYGL